MWDVGRLDSTAAAAHLERVRGGCNWSAIGGLVVGVAAIAGYFTVVTPLLGPRVPWLRDVPALNLALVAGALWLSWRGARRARWPARIAAGLNVALAALFAFYLFGFSAMLPPALAAPGIGQSAPDFALADQRGRHVTLAGLRGRPVVLVFYRGFW